MARVPASGSTRKRIAALARREFQSSELMHEGRPTSTSPWQPRRASVWGVATYERAREHGVPPGLIRVVEEMFASGLRRRCLA